MLGLEAWPRPRGQNGWPRPRPRPRGSWPRPRPRGPLASASDVRPRASRTNEASLCYYLDRVTAEAAQAAVAGSSRRAG
jgi:hypothetical protein